MKNITSLLVTICITGFSYAQTFTNYTTSNGLLSDNVNCVDTDAAGVVWFGTQDGVSVFNGTTWTNYTAGSNPGLVDNTIQAIHCAANGDVWVGTDFGASVFSAATWTSYTTTSGLANNQIKCITEDGAGDIWFGTSAGASKYDGAAWTNVGTAQGLPFGGVNEIDVKANGEVWFGTGLSGIRLYNSVVTGSITETNGLIDNRIRAMVFDQQDKKWIGTSEGISVLGTTNALSFHYTTIFTLPPPDTLNPIEDIEMDSDGNMWVGVYVDYLVTEGGVCAYNGNQWLEFDVADGLVGPVIRALAIDNNDDVWVATSTGVTKISNTSLALEKLTKLSFKMYPNPASDEVTLLFEKGTENTQVEVYNSSMQWITNHTLSGQELRLSTRDLSPGMYFVKFGTQVSKLVIEE